jgi:hypothetical protein
MQAAVESGQWRQLCGSAWLLWQPLSLGYFIYTYL